MKLKAGVIYTVTTMLKDTAQKHSYALMDNTYGWSPEAWAHPATDIQFNPGQITQLDPRPTEVIGKGPFDVTVQDQVLHLRCFRCKVSPGWKWVKCFKDLKYYSCHPAILIHAC